MDADKHLNSIMKELFAQANQDGKITDEEWVLIQSIEIQIDNYIAGLEYALEDGIIDPEERDRLQYLVQKILDTAKEAAEDDGIIDEDEQDLLQVLKSILSIYLS